MSGIKINRHRGFTIVELLIVVVVIAILAAISIVAFNGIQARAKLVQQTAELDRIGKAIQLWSAETGKTLGESGTGYNGNGIGFFNAKSSPSYTATSVEDLLRNAQYITGEFSPSAFNKNQVLLTPCTDYSNPRWVVLATVSPAPSRSVADQISDTKCTNPLISSYSGPGYNSNLIKAY